MPAIVVRHVLYSMPERTAWGGSTGLQFQHAAPGDHELHVAARDRERVSARLTSTSGSCVPRTRPQHSGQRGREDGHRTERTSPLSLRHETAVVVTPPAGMADLDVAGFAEELTQALHGLAGVSTEAFWHVYRQAFGTIDEWQRLLTR